MMKPTKLSLGLIPLCLSVFYFAATAEEAAKDINAISTNGDQVVLHPNGRWEFIDSKKAVQSAEIAKQYLENQGCSHGEQGGFLGLGRCIPVGDKDFNRGSGIGKGR